MAAVESMRRAFSIHDYARMRESGILSEDDRVELIGGDIRPMGPIGPQHAAVVTKIVRFLTGLVSRLTNIVGAKDFRPYKTL